MVQRSAPRMENVLRSGCGNSDHRTPAGSIVYRHFPSVDVSLVRKLRASEWSGTQARTAQARLVYLLRAPGSARADVDRLARPERGNPGQLALQLPLFDRLHGVGRHDAQPDVHHLAGRGPSDRASVCTLDVLQPGPR